jgi:hypothetical protein
MRTLHESQRDNDFGIPSKLISIHHPYLSENVLMGIRAVSATMG